MPTGTTRRTHSIAAIAVSAITAIATLPATAQDSTGTPTARVAAYDILRMRATPDGEWMTATAIAVRADTVIATVHPSRGRSPVTVRVMLDTLAAVERRTIRPGSRAMAAAEGLYWGTIAGGIVGWLAGAAYGTVAGGTTWNEGGERGMLIGASTLGIGGAITLGSRHMRGDNGPESIRVEWVPLAVGPRADRAR